jgi:hypothetical protein
MKLAYPAALFAVILTQVFVSRYLADFAGYSSSLSLIGAEISGALFGIVAAVVVSGAFRVRKPGWIHLLFVVAVAAAVILGRPLIVPAFASGFERRALEKAPVRDWENLAPGVGRSLAMDGAGNERDLPEFVLGMYRERKPYQAVTEAEAGVACLTVWWRDAGVCVGFEIGKIRSARPRILYSRKISDSLVMVVFPDA